MFDLSFTLLQLIENVVFQKSYYKKYVFILLSISSFKIVYALLRKLIKFYRQIAIIEV